MGSGEKTRDAVSSRHALSRAQVVTQVTTADLGLGHRGGACRLSLP